MRKLLPHWESFVQNMLPAIPIFGSTAVEAWNRSLDLYKEPGLYEFMETPFGAFCHTFYKAMVHAGLAPKVAEMQMRILTEEAYSVMTFQQQGCRIVKPTAELIIELLHTDTKFKLTDIRPPWPHVYIQMPPDLGLKLQDFYTGEARDITGYYATWSESGEETKKQYQAALDAARAAGGDTAQAISMFGDWCARFVAHTVDQQPKPGAPHNQTIRFFNMHWSKESTWSCEEAYAELRKVWKAPIPPDEDKFQEMLFRLTTNLFAYMALPQAQRDVIWKPDPERERLRHAGTSWNSKRKRNLRNRIRDEMRTETWEVGQTITIQRRTAKERDYDATTGEVGRSVRTHWRRGHLRNVWVGKHETPERHLEPRYIRPVLIIGRGEAPETVTMIVK